MCQFSESGAPSLGSQHGMKFAYSALEGALPAIVDEVAGCHFVTEVVVLTMCHTWSRLLQR